MNLALLLTVAALASAQPARADQPSRVPAPGLVLPPPVSPLAVPRPPAARPYPVGAPGRTETQLTNRRTGVTCTLRIVGISPSVDPGMLLPFAAPPPAERRAPAERRRDSGIRDDLSPCIE